MNYFTFDTLTTHYFAVLFVICAISIKIHFNRAFKYWEKRHVPLLGQPSFLYGNIPKVFLEKTPFIGVFLKEKYSYGKSQGFKHGGVYYPTTPGYIPIDLNYIKDILQKSFDHFPERGFYYNEKDDILSANIFAIGGKKWEILRKKLSPIFTPTKLKLLLKDMVECGQQMGNFLNLSGEKREINIQDVSQRLAIDVIGSCVFGLQCNSFKYPNAEFRRHGRKVFSFSVWRAIKVVFAFSFSNLARRMGIRLFDDESTHFFLSMIKECIQNREINNTERKDLVQILLELKNDDGDKNQFSIEELTAQAFVFFAAGFETSALTLTFCLYEMAIHEEIQNKLRDEIKREFKNQTRNYESIMNLKYLNQVLEETLRKHPPVPFIMRSCVKDYVVPGTQTVIEKGTRVGISILGIHHDPEFYPNPEIFDPDRFSEENKKKRDPFTYLPFGEGPRICIGTRFAMLELKVALIVLLQNYKFSLSKNTEVPYKVHRFTFTMVPDPEIVLDVTPC